MPSRLVTPRTPYPMRNIELKALLPDYEFALAQCAALAAAAQGDIHQIDTYFNVTKGRLKLREAKPGQTELVYYERPDQPGPKGCGYLLHTVDGAIKPFLDQALGTLVVVDKVRTLYLWKNVRIHLDRVAELGEFIEFEAVLDEEHDDADGQEKLDFLIKQFKIQDHHRLSHSYLDLRLNEALLDK